MLFLSPNLKFKFKWLLMFISFDHFITHKRNKLRDDYQNISSLMAHLLGILIILTLSIFGNYLVVENYCNVTGKFLINIHCTRKKLSFQRTVKTFPSPFSSVLSLFSCPLLLSQSVPCLFLFSKSLKPISSRASRSRETVAHICQWTGLETYVFAGTGCLARNEIPFWGMRVGNA